MKVFLQPAKPSQRGQWWYVCVVLGIFPHSLYCCCLWIAMSAEEKWYDVWGAKENENIKKLKTSEAEWKEGVRDREWWTESIKNFESFGLGNKAWL